MSTSRLGSQYRTHVVLVVKRVTLRVRKLRSKDNTVRKLSASGVW